MTCPGCAEARIARKLATRPHLRVPILVMDDRHAFERKCSRILRASMTDDEHRETLRHYVQIVKRASEPGALSAPSVATLLGNVPSLT